MTDREKAIIMAYTGTVMLEGEKFNIFHKYVEEICERPVFTHELATMHQQIQEKSKQDFLDLCSRENAVQIDLDGFEPVLDMNMDLLSLGGMRFLATIGAVSEVVGRINIIRLNLLERYFTREMKKENKNENDTL